MLEGDLLPPIPSGRRVPHLNAILNADAVHGFAPACFGVKQVPQLRGAAPSHKHLGLLLKVLDLRRRFRGREDANKAPQSRGKRVPQ